MPTDDYRPRLSILITEKQFAGLRDKLPPGTRTPLFQLIVDDILNLIDIHGEIIIAAILSGDITVIDFIRGKTNVNNI